MDYNMLGDKTRNDNLARIADQLERIADLLEKFQTLIGKGERGRDYIRTIDVGRD